MKMSPFRRVLSCLVAAWLCQAGARGEAMLQLFQMNWNDLTAKMPELAEAGYTSLWLPQPAKCSSVFSVGYDLFDPFDLGDQNQRGSVATKYGTKAELLRMVETAHRFGIRVYFDNVMNHRAGIVPGYDAYTPTNTFPGLRPQDFHLQTTAYGNRNWPDVQDWGNQWDVQYETINGLCDLATEPGSVNGNFGPALGSTTPKLVFIRHPANPEYYLDPAGPSLGGPWRPFYAGGGTPVADDVNSYLIRAAMWTVWTTKCDGFRMDAVKHVPSPFFGSSSGNPTADEPTFSGYTGAIQAMFDYTHGYGNNVTGNGYLEADGNRNSLFDTEATRNDAMLFGEHLGSPPSYQEYLNNGMRLLNSPLRTVLNGALQGGGSLPSGLDQRDYIAYGGAFSAIQGVQFAEDHDHLLCCPTHRELQNAYYFMHEGLPMIYSDNFNWAGSPSSEQTFPQVPMTDYLGQYGDNTMPETSYLHNQLARGGTRARWSDSHIVAFERYDYRDVGGDAYTNPDATVVLFAMNATYNNPTGDVLFDDGVARTADGYYGCYNGSPSKGVGLVVGFPPGSVLAQMAASSPNGGNGRTCAKLLVHQATTNKSEAQATANDPIAVNRKIYVGSQSLAPGGGAIELLVPAGGWVMYGYQWPEASCANSATNAIAFRQGGLTAPSVLVYRRDGSNGDPNFSPYYPFKMRGSVDANGNVVLASGEGHVSSVTNAFGVVTKLTNSYAIQIPVLTNAPFDIAVRCDASATNVLVKMDGGLDLNSQMALGPSTGFDRRDNRPGYASDVYLGYEQSVLQTRYGPEKFAARDSLRDTVVSTGAETYYYTVGGTSTVVNGVGGAQNVKAQTADWVYHDPAAPNTATNNGTATQRVPLNPGAGQAVDIWVKAGYQFFIDKCFIYYTTDGTNPEGWFGTGRGTTQVAEGHWVAADSAETRIDWWKGTLPAAASGTQVRYKVALFKGGAYGPVETISDADDSKLYGLTQFGITNFNTTTARVWLHNDLNTNHTAVGLSSGFHIVRARCFLPRNGKSAVYNTFLQTFYYDGQLPGGVIAYPATNGASLTGSSYTVVVRADSSVTEVAYTIQDSYGTTSGIATKVNPDGTLSAQYPAYPQEFRFTYGPVPSSGQATISAQLKTFATGAYPDRLTTLARSVNTLAPAQVVNIVSPAADGMLLTLYSNNNFSYTLQTCFSSALASSSNFFSIYINGALQPREAYIFRASGCGTGMRTLYYTWTNAASATNVIDVIYTNGLTLADSRAVAVARYGDPLDTDSDGVADWLELIAGTSPNDSNSYLRITGLVTGTPTQLTWASVPGLTYQVLSTTNLAVPFAPVANALVPADPSNPVTHWFDPSPDAAKKFYRIQLQQ